MLKAEVPSDSTPHQVCESTSRDGVPPLGGKQHTLPLVVLVAIPNDVGPPCVRQLRQELRVLRDLLVEERKKVRLAATRLPPLRVPRRKPRVPRITWRRWPR